MNLGPETEYVERKRSTGELREGMESIASILNKHGHGTLFFGVRNDGEVVGQDVSDSTLRKVSQAIGSSISPTIFPRVEACDDDGRGYIKVSFEGDEAPYSCNGRFRMRVADEDLMMSDEELRSQVLRAQARRVPWDQWESPRPISDVDEEELRSFVERGNACGRIAESFTTVEDTLGRLKLLRNGRLTNAAEVLFCPPPPPGPPRSRWASWQRTPGRRSSTSSRRRERSSISSALRSATSLSIRGGRSSLTGSALARRFPSFLPPPYARCSSMRLRTETGPRVRASRSTSSPTRSKSPTLAGSSRGRTPPTTSPESTTPLSRNDLIVTTLHKSRDIEAYGTGIPRIRDTCAEAGVEFGYERVPIGTRFVFHRADPFSAVPLPPTAANGRQRPPTAANGRQACRKTTVGSSSSSGRTERPRPPWSRRNSASPCARRGRRSAASLTRA